jgi:hypothetical protein
VARYRAAKAKGRARVCFLRHFRDRRLPRSPAG